jgi:uncharacterized short protein YbdD (DUF466 family)|uniref:Uncharacterized protein n=1 Tax=viral metagenome TaxID=1070528 RepID=A0A6C0LAV0_9ZZZZ
MSTLNAIQIQSLVRNMDESLRKYKKLKQTNNALWLKKIQDENKKLFMEYPTIFKMHIEGKLDETFFYMLQLRHKIEKGEMTEDQASVLVGQKLFNRYVDPVINNTPKEPTLTYEEYYKKFEK